MSQHFAAIQKNSPLGMINLNNFQDQSNTHDGPHAQYKPHVYAQLMNHRPSATLAQGSAQNQLILQKLQEATGNSSRPFPSKTLAKSGQPVKIVEPVSIPSSST